VRPTPSVADGPLTGIGQVVLAVDDVADTVELFRDLYGCPRPVAGSVPGFGEVASLPGTPVAIVAAAGTPWLEARRDRFREGPCSCLLATDDLDAARDALALTEPAPWPDGRVAFFESEDIGRRLGVVERA
jgi:catechol 2,3-dioxygenase-like lactoylglutathione lyase family enzyme